VEDAEEAAKDRQILISLLPDMRDELRSKIIIIIVIIIIIIIIIFIL